jgi:aspartyl-tRNA(Asn)/glutamyl-tRNA(Gln) amidotransferase subunit A
MNNQMRELRSAFPGATDLVRELRLGAVTPREVAEDHLQRVSANTHLNAFLWVDQDQVIAAAPHSRVRGPLAGMPLALKDNIDTAGIPTTSGSLIDQFRVPDTDATCWKRLRDSGGATLLGKAHLCEYAASRFHHPALGWVRNPRDPSRASGGSSSGSAAAVAAGLAPAAIGTDSGGSIRIPAAYCGVVGFQGTHGLIENTGVVPVSNALDHVGVLARSVADAAMVFEVMAPRRLGLVDPTTLRTRAVNPRRLRVGIETGFFVSRAQSGVLRCWSRAARLLEDNGSQMVEIRLPDAARWRIAHRRILYFDVWNYHAARLRSGAPYGPGFRSVVSQGERITVREYERALAARNHARQEMEAVFKRIDVLLTPTCPTVAPPREEGRKNAVFNRYTSLAPFVGIPAISIPAGTGAFGLPVGVQLIGSSRTEARLVAVAAMLESLLASATSTES